MNVSESRAGDIMVDVDPFSLEYLSDPHPSHERMRATGPVFRFQKYDAWGMARYKEVSTAMQDYRTYINEGGVGITDLRRAPSKVMARRLTLEIDPPDHGKYRKVFTDLLNPGTIRQLRQEFKAKAEDFVDELVKCREFDAVHDLAEAFPLKVFSDAIGLQQEGRRENLLPWSEAVFNSFGPDNDLLMRSVEVVKSVYPWVMASCNRENLAPGRLGSRIYQAVDRGEIDPDDAPLLVRPFLTAGLDTTIAGIGSAIYALALFPGQWKLLRENPDLSRAAFEEALRWESPIQAFFRTTSCPVTVEGIDIPSDAKVLMFMGSANRDPSRWDSPEEYRINRHTIGHLAFGVGIHTCVGQMIARLEGEVMLTSLAQRIASIELAGEAKYKPNNTMRGLATLPVRVSPR